MENKLLQAERTRQLLLTEMYGLRSHVAALEAKLSRDMSLDEQLAASRAVESESRKKQQKIDKLNAEVGSVISLNNILHCTPCYNTLLHLLT